MRLLSVFLLAACISLAPAADKDTKSRNRTEAKQVLTTLTGVIDQAGDEFILSSEDTMGTKAVLRAQGFTADNFARFVGNRVEVRGEMQVEGERRVLMVKSLDHLKPLGPAGTQK